MEERFLKKAKQLAKLVVIANCEACQTKQEIPYYYSTNPSVYTTTVTEEDIAKAVFENFELVTIDEVDLLICSRCKNSTSLTDLRAIAGRVRREVEKKSNENR